MPRWGENEDLFESELRRGHEYAVVIGRRFRASGLHVEVTAPSLARTRRGRDTYTRQDVDLIVHARGGQQVVEIKSRRIRFSGPDDWPASHDPAMVDTVAGWQAKAHRPVAIVLVSQITLGAAVVPRSSLPYWQIVKVRDRRREIPTSSYACPSEHLRSFGELCDWMKET